MITERPERIRVLHAVKSLGLGGTEKAMQLMAGHLDRERFQVLVFSFEDGVRRGLLRRAGIPVTVGPDLLAVLSRFKPHVVHIHRAGWPEPDLLAPVRRHHPPAVVETNVFGRLDDSPLEKTIDLHLFISRFCLDRLLAHHGRAVDPARYRVLSYPVDTDLFERLTPPQDFGRPVAGRLSRPDPGKWSGLVCDTTALLAAARPDFRFRVIGAIPAFERFLDERGLRGSVECLPPVATDEELAAFFGSVGLLAHANDTGESFGLAIAEAMAAGLPVVTHPAAGQRDNAQLELVEHGRTGFVARDAREYAQAVLWLWDNPERARAMGLAGRDKARRLFRAQDIAASLGDIYLELLAR